MRRFLLRRVGQVIGTIFGVVTLIFFLQRLTGDPTYLLVPETATQADIDAMRAALVNLMAQPAEARAAMGRRGKEFVKGTLTRKVVIPQYEELLRSIACG